MQRGKNWTEYFSVLLVHNACRPNCRICIPANSKSAGYTSPAVHGALVLWTLNWLSTFVEKNQIVHKETDNVFKKPSELRSATQIIISVPLRPCTGMKCARYPNVWHPIPFSSPFSSSFLSLSRTILSHCFLWRDVLETVINSRKLSDAQANPSTQRKRYLSPIWQITLYFIRQAQLYALWK